MANLFKKLIQWFKSLDGSVECPYCEGRSYQKGKMYIHYTKNGGSWVHPTNIITSTKGREIIKKHSKYE